MQDEEQQQQEQPEAPEQDAAAEAPEQDAAAEAAEPAAPAAPPVEEAEPLTPKQRRKLARSTFTGPAGPPRSADQRIEERRDERSRRARERSRWRSKQGERRPAERGPARTEPTRAGESHARKVRQGLVVSAKPNKTITVRIDVVRTHPVYGKVIRNTSTLHAHDEANQANEGDVVRIVECRPLSRTKRWRLVEVLERAR